MADGLTSHAAREVPTVADDYVVQAGSNTGLAEVSLGVLAEFNELLDDELGAAIHEVGKSTRTDLRSNSPKDTGSYSRSWGCDFSDKEGHHEAVVVNRKHWQITHLLEDGHDIKNRKGGPTLGHVGPADPEHHLQQAQERGIRKLEQLLGIGGA